MKFSAGFCALFSYAVVATAAVAQDANADKETIPAMILHGEWEYSIDGGKTFDKTPPKIAGTHTVPQRTDAARVKFTVDDPAKIGLLRVAMSSGIGGFAVTNAASVDRYNVGTCPTMLNTKITLNDKIIDAGQLPFTLYEHLALDSALLKKGENTLLLNGNLWHKNYDKGEVPAAMQLDVLPTDLAMLDRLPILGIVGEDYFGLAARSVIPAKFRVTVTPLEPKSESQSHDFPKSRLLKARVPLPKDIKRFQYEVTVLADGASKTYGPYEAKVPTRGVGFRFVAAGGTLYRGPTDQIDKLYAAVREADADVFIHTGNYQNCPAWDFMWTNEFLRVGQPTLAEIPLFPMTNGMDLISPISFRDTFFIPPDDKDWGHWTVVIGNVRFVTVEAFNQSQDKTGSSLKWLEDVLKDAEEDYVIVLNGHASHCSPKPLRVFREGAAHTQAKITPLLIKYNVTATIGSIHRCYERIEPIADETVPTILTGKAGGMGWPIRTDEKNPNKASKILSGVDHYCVFEVTGDGLVMTAIDFDGKTIDTRTYKPRAK